MKETNSRLDSKKNINEQLGNTFGIVFKGLIDLEKENVNKKEAVLNDISCETDKILSKPMVPLEIKKKIVIEKTKTSSLPVQSV